MYHTKASNIPLAGEVIGSDGLPNQLNCREDEGQVPLVVCPGFNAGLTYQVNIVTVSLGFVMT